jgi:nitrile hydratase accessory protein
VSDRAPRGRSADGSPPLDALPRLPREGDEPVFREPWEAHAFAMALALHRRGVFTWPEWATALAAQIEAAQAAGDADLGDTYYRHWLAALETLVEAKGAGLHDDLERYRSAWAHAAARTPHGRPIELEAADFEPAPRAR